MSSLSPSVCIRNGARPFLQHMWCTLISAAETTKLSKTNSLIRSPQPGEMTIVTVSLLVLPPFDELIAKNFNQKYLQKDKAAKSKSDLPPALKTATQTQTQFASNYQTNTSKVRQDIRDPAKNLPIKPSATTPEPVKANKPGEKNGPEGRLQNRSASPNRAFVKPLKVADKVTGQNPPSSKKDAKKLGLITEAQNDKDVKKSKRDDDLIDNFLGMAEKNGGMLLMPRQLPVSDIVSANDDDPIFKLSDIKPHSRVEEKPPAEEKKLKGPLTKQQKEILKLSGKKL